MKKKIDEIFIQSEFEKSLEVRPELWNRLERRLDDDPMKKRLYPWMIAASFFIIAAFSILLILNIDTYKVEDMDIEVNPNFSKEEIADLEKVYWIPPSIFLNPDIIETL